MPTSKEKLEKLVEDSANKARETIARSQQQRLIDEQSWRAGYDVLTEGALGDYPE